MVHPRVVLVTGASSGIGKVCAEHLHARGFRVYGTSRRAGQASSPSDGASGASRGTQAVDAGPTLIPLDVRCDDSVARAISLVLDREGAIDAVVNNAGFGVAGAVEETTVEEAVAQFETNFFGTVRVCRAVLPVMRRQRSGYVVNVSSIAGQIGIPFQAIYSASKFAVEGFTEALRMEVAPFGIRVSLVEPGDFRTGFTASRRVSANTTSAYLERQQRAISVMERAETRGATPEAVALLVEHILTSHSPRLRYAVGPVGERVAVMLKRIVPARLFELGIASYYRVR